MNHFLARTTGNTNTAVTFNKKKQAFTLVIFIGFVSLYFTRILVGFFFNC